MAPRAFRGALLVNEINNEFNSFTIDFGKGWRVKRMRILIVDDMPVNLMIISEMFKMTNVEEAEICADGELAIAMTMKTHYDLIILDHRMPGMDGVEVLQHLKERWRDKNEPETPVIMLTGNDREGDSENYAKLGFSEYLAKPVTPGQLFAVCGKFLPDLIFNVPEEHEDSPDPVMSLPKWLRRIDGLDVSSGLNNCGTPQNYIDGLRIFASSSGRRADELERLLAKADITGYGIKVHALKGIAGMLGAGELKARAAELEKASDAGDTDFILYGNAGLTAGYRRLGNSLCKGFGINEEYHAPGEAASLTGSELRDAYVTIRECLDFYDYESVAVILDTLDEYALSGSEEENVRLMREALAAIDRKRMIRLAETNIAEPSA